MVEKLFVVSSFALQNTPALQDRKNNLVLGTRLQKKSLVFHGFYKNEEEREGKELGALTKKGERWYPEWYQKFWRLPQYKFWPYCHKQIKKAGNNTSPRQFLFSEPNSSLQHLLKGSSDGWYTVTPTTRSQSPWVKKWTRLSDDPNNDWVGDKQRSCYIQTYGAPDPCVPKLSQEDDQPNIQNTKDKWKKILPQNQPGIT